MSSDDVVFEAHRPRLLGLAYRILGDLARAEDLVQEAWLRWEQRKVQVDAPASYLTRIVTNLCLNDRDSARARYEFAGGVRLPEPVDTRQLAGTGLERAEAISMAFMVVLQRLTAAERAVFVLHEVFDYGHAEIATMLGRTDVACRQLLRRARTAIETEKRTLETPVAVQRRLLRAFVTATRDGDLDALAEVLAEDAVLVADAGPGGSHFGRVRNLPGPLRGGTRIAAFVAAAMERGPGDLTMQERELNGGPALLVLRGGSPYAVFSVAVADDEIERIYLHADTHRLKHLAEG